LNRSDKVLVKQIAHSLKNDNRLICPYCGAVLNQIFQHGYASYYETIRLDWQNGKYKQACIEDSELLEFEVEGYTCPECGAELSSSEVERKI